MSTIGELYSPAMKIQTQEEADIYFEKLVQEMMSDYGQTREEATSIQKQNLGYYAGYYDTETMQRVNKLFNTIHPIFGNSTPTPEETLKMGQDWAEKENV